MHIFNKKDNSTCDSKYESQTFILLTCPQHRPPRLSLIQSDPGVCRGRAPMLTVAGQGDQVTRSHITVDGAVRRRGRL